jgi:hypothetical protein
MKFSHALGVISQCSSMFKSPCVVCSCTYPFFFGFFSTLIYSNSFSVTGSKEVEVKDREAAPVVKRLFT